MPQVACTQTVKDALVGLDNTPVELVTGTLNIQALNAGIYIGTAYERLEGSQAFRVNMRGPIRKSISSGALVCPCYVTMTSTGLAAAASGNKCCGIAIYPFTPAQNDIVSYIQTDCVMP